ncbi:hypothetical protein A9G45_01360 [Gilliamella sp. HK2]|jgi:hypothetical protein|uniref:hypothetical protein n=1 Tax=unclassified Gilliamella TaxID=2685620 RepID=UPI00080E1FC0|nr:hypothetical protein [Gilliamella apicola]OCG28992.1 hypothetical protein A9G46_01745 [Gilliamella apicola]OCG31443.1 hypothetical protein A9G45_01360 [Gilliamella apicola]
MNKEELINLIAKENNVMLGKDDPILMLITANDYLIKELELSLSKILAENRTQLELNFSQYDESVKNNAEKILNAALIASKKTLTDHITESATEFKKLINDEILAAKIDIEVESKKIGFYSKINLTLLIFIMLLMIFIYFS